MAQSPEAETMWLTDLLRKMTQGPDVGETFRDYIGCYMFGREVTGSLQPEYLGAPTQVQDLQDGLQQYLQGWLQTPDNADSPYRNEVQTALQTLPERLRQHLASDMQQPLMRLGNVDIFVRKGIRQRRKENGKFVE